VLQGTLDLVGGAPYWPIASGLLGVYPPLTEDQRCAVAVVGAGLTGALVAYILAGEGIDVVVVDRRDVARGSTAASTALLTWELDVELAALIDRLGKGAALRAYRASLEAVATIGRIAASLPMDCGFVTRSSLYLASHPGDRDRLEREAELRAEHGFPSEFWDPGRLAATSCFRAAGAIRNEAAGEIDPYRFTHALLQAAVARGARVFDRTEIVKEKDRDNGVELISRRGPVIRADRVVMAPGYELPRPLRRELVSLSSTYVLATEPVGQIAGWEDRALVWESARPYFYLRSTPDGRLMIGGEDEPFRNPARRDRLIPAKTAALARKLSELLPDTESEPAFAWAGTFGTTADGLPAIGELAGSPNRIYALGYGANGNTFAMVAAQVVLDILRGVETEDQRLFRMDR
jgi:glycine/D-amino acid oxidase-like deaminating enzyme